MGKAIPPPPGLVALGAQVRVPLLVRKLKQLQTPPPKAGQRRPRDGFKGVMDTLVLPLHVGALRLPEGFTSCQPETPQSDHHRTKDPCPL